MTDYPYTRIVPRPPQTARRAKPVRALSKIEENILIIALVTLGLSAINFIVILAGGGTLRLAWYVATYQPFFGVPYPY